MKTFVPKINCGLAAGEEPMVWKESPKFFNSEEECDKWIEENTDWFAANELSGGIYAHEIKDSDIDFYKEIYGIFDWESYLKNH